MGALLQDCYLTGAVRDRQFVGKALFLSDCDYALFVLFFGLIYCLDRRFTVHLMCTTRTVDSNLLLTWVASKRLSASVRVGIVLNDCLRCTLVVMRYV